MSLLQSAYQRKVRQYTKIHPYNGWIFYFDENRMIFIEGKGLRIAENLTIFRAQS